MFSYLRENLSISEGLLLESQPLSLGASSSLAEQKGNLKREVFICSLLFEFKPDPKGRL